MRKIYLTVFIIFSVSVFLFFVSFVYLDKHNHTTYHYTISLNGQYVGAAKVDKFVTEDKLIYKSNADMPFGELFTEERIRLDLDRKYNLEDFQRELFANGGAYLFCAQAKGNAISFLSRFMSRFSCLKDMPVRKGTFVFEEESPVTYLPIIENYDFKRGKSQGFSSIIYLPDNKMLPVKRFVTLTSIKDEYLKIEHRRIKTENLLLKIKGRPSGSVWVAKSDRSLMVIDIPSIGLKITRTFEPKEILSKELVSAPDGYVSNNVTFRSKNRQLAGTITIPAPAAPQPTAKYPAVLLVWGAGPQDRDYQGFFKSIADYLSRNGYCVLRFDRRGVGASGDDAISETTEDEFEDISAALNFLRSNNDVDRERISVIAHSEGALNAMRLAAGNPGIRGVILMAPSMIDPKEAEALIRDRAKREKWDDEYLQLTLRSLRETREKAVKARYNWGYILGRRCYLKAVRDDDAARPFEIIEKVSSPILILYGKNDADLSVEYAASFDRALTEYGMTRSTTTYFGYLGHFFGKLINNGASKMHYEVDGEAMSNIRNWLDRNSGPRSE